MNKLSFIKALWSPFKPFKLKWHVGRIAIGTPYFFPRRWIKDKDKPGWMKAIPKKIGFDFVPLGWKTKWGDTDYRFEWSPILSFVLFKWQIAVIVVAPEQSHYWEAWLYYENNTPHNLSKRERITMCRKEFPMVWIASGGVKIDYYEKVLKKKYLNI